MFQFLKLKHFAKLNLKVGIKPNKEQMAHVISIQK